MKFESTPFKGLTKIYTKQSADDRGLFVKPFHAKMFQDNGLRTDFVESFYSTSHKGVVRGMHFQKQPHEHAKLVYCTSGAVYDVAVDLRSASPTRGKHFAIELNSANATALYIPEGFAHGFCALEPDSTIVYMVTSLHVPEADSGLLWSSCGIKWPISNFQLSPRDNQFPPLSFVLDSSVF